MDCIICRYGELALKGKNRHVFESRLVHNIKDGLNRNSIKFELKKIRGRIFIFTEDQAALEVLPKVFGLVSISPAVISDNDPQVIKETVIDYVSKIPELKSIKTFRISTKRTNKDFSRSSNEMDNFLGESVGNKFKLKAKMKGPDLNVGVEIHDRTFIFHQTIPCFGGLPLGMGGKVAALIENEASIAAAWLMMKRGCIVFPLAKKKQDIDVLKSFSHGSRMELNIIKDLIEINRFAEDASCQALITGDTFDTLNNEKYLDIDIMLLSPLIAYGDSDIKLLLEPIR